MSAFLARSRIVVALSCDLPRYTVAFMARRSFSVVGTCFICQSRACSIGAMRSRITLSDEPSVYQDILSTPRVARRSSRRQHRMCRQTRIAPDPKHRVIVESCHVAFLLLRADRHKEAASVKDFLVANRQRSGRGVVRARTEVPRGQEDDQASALPDRPRSLSTSAEGDHA